MQILQHYSYEKRKNYCIFHMNNVKLIEITNATWYDKNRITVEAEDGERNHKKAESMEG